MLKVLFKHILQKKTGEGSQTNADEAMDEDTDVYVLVMCSFIAIYVMFQAFIEHKKIHVIHETGLGIIFGMILGYILYAKDEITEFNGEFFFIYILPPIIFAAGYNLKKEKFFKNIFYIVLYAVLGTIVNFLVTLGFMILFNHLGWIYTNNGKLISMSTANILYFSCTMCASDAIAGLTLISSDKYPKLFSVVFGEGLLNDAVAIILFHSVSTIAGDSGSEFTASQGFNLVLNFFTTCLASVSIGLVIGLFVCWLFRKCRMFYHNAMTEVVIILTMGYIAYVASEALGQSGVIALLTCGIVMSHYLTYNLSASGVISSGITLQTISQIAESFLFIYLGISFWFYFSSETFGDISMGFIGLGLGAVIVARVFCIWVLSGIAYLIKRKAWNLNVYEISIIWFAGMIRGAVAFALIQTVHSNCKDGDEDCRIQNLILKSSIMAIVFFSTIVLGAFMPLYIKIHTAKMEKMLENKQEKAQTQIEDETKTDPLLSNKTNEESNFDSIREQEIKKKYKNGCIRFFKMLDENFLKPAFIYNYKVRKEEITFKKKLLKKNATETDTRNEYKTLARLQNTVFQQSGVIEYKVDERGELSESQHGETDQDQSDFSKNQSYDQEDHKVQIQPSEKAQKQKLAEKEEEEQKNM